MIVYPLNHPLVLPALVHHYRLMDELIRTNNLVTVSFAESLLKEEGIEYFVADQNMSIMDGSLGILPRRIMVEGGKLERARRLMKDAGLGDELPEKPVRDRL